MNVAIRELLKHEVKFTFTPLDEDAQVEDHFDNWQSIKWVRQQIDKGNKAAWFCAAVYATWNGHQGASVYLGCCSYESFEAFEADVYYEQLCNDALEELNKTIDEAFFNLRPLMKCEAA